jgi:hypothetical protein
MVKWFVGLLLLVNILLFAVMQWGGALTVDKDIPVVQAEINPDKIKLLGGVAPASSSVSATTVASEVVPAVAASAVIPAQTVSIPTSELGASPKAHKQCAEWGEFSGSGLALVQTALAELSLGDKLTQSTVEHDSGFWVFLPPVKKRAEVQHKIEQLKKLGVTDYFVVQETGVWMNAISLGVFRTEKSAQKYLASLRDKGVHSAKVGERKSKLKYTQFVLKDLDAATTDKVRNLQKDFPDNDLKIADCN